MGPSAGSAPAAAGGQDQSGSLHLASAVSPGPQSALFCVPSSEPPPLPELVPKRDAGVTVPKQVTYSPELS